MAYTDKKRHTRSRRRGGVKIGKRKNNGCTT